MLPLQTIQAFDRWLDERGMRFDAVVIGGSALSLLGVIHRPTRDLDVLYPELSPEILAASRAFASHVRGRGGDLDDDWLNNGPMQLVDVLPPGWHARTQPAYSGTALCLNALGRPDLLKTKLFALCERGTDLPDCVALAPSSRELDEALPWLAAQDTNPMWPEHVRATLTDLRRTLRDGV